jgi:hypothetical protein
MESMSHKQRTSRFQPEDLIRKASGALATQPARMVEPSEAISLNPANRHDFGY